MKRIKKRGGSGSLTADLMRLWYNLMLSGMYQRSPHHMAKSKGPIKEPISREFNLAGWQRPIIVKLEAPNLISFKEKGTRTWYHATVGKIMIELAMKAASKPKKKKPTYRGI